MSRARRRKTYTLMSARGARWECCTTSPCECRLRPTLRDQLGFDLYSFYDMSRMESAVRSIVIACD